MEKIDLVDLDAEMIRICSTEPNITSVNQNSLDTDKLVIHIMDAYEYLEDHEERYDLIIVDLPDPNCIPIFFTVCVKTIWMRLA